MKSLELQGQRNESLLKTEGVLGPHEKYCLTGADHIIGQTEAVKETKRDDLKADLEGKNLTLNTIRITRAALFVEKRGIGKDNLQIESSTKLKTRC